jgi:RNA polymerase sigma factor (sigma-70 family)
LRQIVRAPYDLTSPQLLAKILRVNRDRREAEEVLQEVFVSAWIRSGQFDPQRGNVMAWLTSIARNEAVNSLRHRERRAASLTKSNDEGEDPYESLPSERLQPPDALGQSRAARAVQERLAALPEGQRSTLFLAFYAGLFPPGGSRAARQTSGNGQNSDTTISSSDAFRTDRARVRPEQFTG